MGPVCAALISTSVLLLGVPSDEATSWVIGLLVISMIIPPFAAEADLRSRPGGHRDKRIWGDSQFWGTMGTREAIYYLLSESHRVIQPRDTPTHADTPGA